MRAVVQRVQRASVHIAGQPTSAIGRGFLILLGIQDGDQATDLEWLCGKIGRLRIFPDQSGKMTLALTDIQGEALVVSQFTLLASTARGNRPDFLRSAKPDEARALYEAFVAQLGQQLGTPVKTGVFAADMQVELLNDGPVTIIMDSRLRE